MNRRECRCRRGWRRAPDSIPSAVFAANLLAPDRMLSGAPSYLALTHHPGEAHAPDEPSPSPRAAPSRWRRFATCSAASRARLAHLQAPIRASVRLAFPQDGDFSLVGAALRARGPRLRGGGERRHRPRKRIRPLSSSRTLRPRPGRRPPSSACAPHRPFALARVASARPGFRPVADAYSPYVMVRLGGALAAAPHGSGGSDLTQVRIAEACGDVIEVGGERIARSLARRVCSPALGFPGSA